MAGRHPIDILGKGLPTVILQAQQYEGDALGLAEDLFQRKHLLYIGGIQACATLLPEKGVARHSNDLGLVLEPRSFCIGTVDEGYRRVVEVELNMGLFAGSLHKIVSGIGLKVPVINLPDDTGEGSIEFPEHDAARRVEF